MTDNIYEKVLQIVEDRLEHWDEQSCNYTSTLAEQNLSRERARIYHSVRDLLKCAMAGDWEELKNFERKF